MCWYWGVGEKWYWHCDELFCYDCLCYVLFQLFCFCDATVFDFNMAFSYCKLVIVLILIFNYFLCFKICLFLYCKALCASALSNAFVNKHWGDYYYIYDNLLYHFGKVVRTEKTPHTHTHTHTHTRTQKKKTKKQQLTSRLHSFEFTWGLAHLNQFRAWEEYERF